VNLPGVNSDDVIESTPDMIYEGCISPRQVPLIIQIAKWLKKILNAGLSEEIQC
jgi:hypothetical protein